MTVTVPFEEAADPDFLALLASCPLRWQGDHGAQLWIEELANASLPAAPTLASLAPASTTAGTAGLSLGATGTNFVTGSVVVFAGMDLVTTFNSATSLSAQVNPGLLANAAVAQVAVRNPSGQISGNQAFAIT